MERLRLNSVSNLTLKVEIDGIKVEKVNGRGKSSRWSTMEEM